MRKLLAKDFGVFSKIIFNMDVREEILNVMENMTNISESDNPNLEDRLGLELIYIILENYWKVEKDFYNFLSSLTGKEVKEIEGLELDEFINIIKDISKDPSFLGFFKLAVQ